MTPPKAQHSPLPWTVHDVAQYTYIRHSFGDEIGAMRSPDKDTQHANARLIVASVNQHAALVSALEQIERDVPCMRKMPCPHCIAREALAKEGK